MRITKALLLGSVALIALACSSITIPSIPPIVIPSIPPIVIPSLPSGETFPPGVLPSADANSGACLLVSAAEMSSLMGGTATVTDNSGNSCSYTFSNFSSVIITLDTGDLNTANILFGDTAKDLTVGNLPAKSGVFIGQPAIYIQRGTAQLQVLGILTGSDDATFAKLVQVATTAVSRWQ